jgi:hypothetical protein
MNQPETGTNYIKGEQAEIDKSFSRLVELRISSSG